MREVVAPEGLWLPGRAIASPIGDWIALTYPSGLDQVVQLHNLQTGETREAARAGMLLDIDQDLRWSPDGQYLALNMHLTTNPDILIYSVRDNKLVNLTADDAENYHAAWSKDSAQIATLTESCKTGVDCSHTLESYSVIEQKREQMVDISYLSQGSGGLGHTICELNWSPDGRYVAFIAGCERTALQRSPVETILKYGYYIGSVRRFLRFPMRSVFSESAIGFPQEVYLWDTLSNKIERITDYTTTETEKPGLNLVYADYKMFWADAKTLLMGAIYGPDEKTRHTQTIAYDVESQVSIILSAAAVDEWAVNPVTGELAIRLVPSLDYDGVAYFYPKDASIRLM